jgi:hypothetical protein
VTCRLVSSCPRRCCCAREDFSIRLWTNLHLDLQRLGRWRSLRQPSRPSVADGRRGVSVDAAMALFFVVYPCEFRWCVTPSHSISFSRAPLSLLPARQPRLRGLSLLCSSSHAHVCARCAPWCPTDPVCSSLNGPFCDCSGGGGAHRVNCSCSSCGTCVECHTCVKCSGPAPPSPPKPANACSLGSYTWQPDVATSTGTCGSTTVTMEVAYLDNATVCSRFSLSVPTGSPRATVRFGGQAARGEHKGARTWASVQGVAARGTGVVVDIAASCAYASPPCVEPVPITTTCITNLLPFVRAKSSVHAS